MRRRRYTSYNQKIVTKCIGNNFSPNLDSISGYINEKYDLDYGYISSSSSSSSSYRLSYRNTSSTRNMREYD